MNKIIKGFFISLFVILTINLSGGISTTSAASYTNIVPANHQEYQGWANLVESIVSPYVDSKNGKITDADLPIIEQKLATMFIQNGAWGCFYQYCDVNTMVETHDLAYFEGGKLIVGCGNLDLLSYNIITPVPGSCVSLSVNNNGTFSCIGNSTAKEYRIYLNGSIISNSSSGYYNVLNPGTYNFECRVDNEVITNNSCKQTVVTAPRPTPGDCTGLTVDNTNGAYTCTGDTLTTDYRLFSNGIQVSTNNTGIFDITNPGAYTFTCLVNGETAPADNECTQQVNVPGEFDLALKKTVTTVGPYNVGDVVEYNIEVINQGITEGINIEVTDHIPVNMELVTGNGWSVMGADRKVTNTIASVPVGTTQNLTIRLRILAGATGTITNWAEISADNGNDCDSTPDNDQENDTFITDDLVGTVCNDTNDDEDDHDPASITIGALVCNATTTGTQASPISVTTPGLCANVGETVVNFASTTSGVTTSYTWNCTDGLTTYTGGNCSASYTTGGGGGGGGGGSTYRCNDMIVTGSQVKCIGSSRVKSFGLLCSNQDIRELTNIKEGTHNDTTNLQEAIFTNTCDISNGETPICYVVDRITSSYGNLAWRTSNACKEIPEQCGNGKLESGEECERAVNDDGTLGEFPNFCSSSCQITSFSTIPTSNGNLITTPNQGEIGFVGMYDMVLGHGANLGVLNNEIYIWNNSDYTFGNSVFNGICLTTNNVAGQVNTGDSLSNIGLTRNCTDITTKFYPGQKIYLKNDLSNIVADKNKVDGADYEDNNLVVTIRTTKDTSPYPKILNWSDHLTGKFRVRVAKPALRTTGGTSYNKAGANTQKIAESENINLENSKIGVNNNDVSVGVKSSDAKTTDENNTDIVEEAGTYNTDSNENIDTSSISSSFENYNGLDNVFIKSGDTNISDIDLSSISESTTYIIENGDLIVDENLFTNHNIAFVVKNGDIIINNDIESIKGTYIVLNNGEIKSDGTNTDNILTVKGSLYGDTSDLVDHRIKVEENNGELTFGTVVSFGSSIFQKPAPMVTSFINDYLKSNKVAQ